jgi:hypothetical protein
MIRIKKILPNIEGFKSGPTCIEAIRVIKSFEYYHCLTASVFCI